MNAKKLIKNALLIVLLLLLYSPFWGFVPGIIRSKRMEAHLRQPQVYEPVGYFLARYCQSDRALFPENFSVRGFPQSLRMLPHGDGFIYAGRTRAIIEMGGGFYHYGYRLRFDPDASNDHANIWRLYLYVEESDNTHLMTITMPPTECLSVREWAEM